MATKVILPMLGQTMEEGTITKWLKQEGDNVEKGEPLLEVMTDKVNMEVESPASGVLRKIIAQVDQTVPVMDVIAIIGTADEPIEDILAELKGEAPSPVSPSVSVPTEPPTPSPVSQPVVQPSSPSRIFASPRARRLAHEHGVDISLLAGRGTGPDGRIVERDVRAYVAEMAEVSKVKATPLAAKIASDKGIDLREIVGSGPGGQITKEDVLRAVTPVSPTFPQLEARVMPFTGLRKMVGDNVAKSAQTAPHVTLTAEVDVTELAKVRKQILEEFERKYGTRLTFTDLITKAVARAILDHPLINSSLQGNEIRIFPDVNIGVAVAVEGGLIVPVIHNADRKSLAEISTRLKELVEKGRSGNLSSAEISGGTFTITNLGSYGVDIFNPIITPGQSAILGVCRIAEKPVVVDGQVAIRSMMNLCLSFDHRVLDGAPAAEFLQTLKRLLESPYQLLI